MSLRHALLAILTAEPMTGYDLLKFFDGTVAFVWQAPHTQIYPELRRMEEEGLLEADEVQRGERATKRVYRISPEGIKALKRWVTQLQPIAPERDQHRLKATYFEWGTYEAARRQLEEHLSHYSEYLRERQQLIDDLAVDGVPLLKRRLKTRPAAEHDAIVGFKVFAFEGEVARAKAEIAWAKDGLALIDRLEKAGVKLSGESRKRVPGAKAAQT